MQEYTQKVRSVAEKLLKDKAVALVIGFRKGSVPLMNEPCCISRPEDAAALVWDSNCGINLTNYLTGRKEKIGIVAKGCDSRNIVNHILEHKIEREQLYIIGIPCKGMVDKHRIAEQFGAEIEMVVEDADSVTASGNGKEMRFVKAEILQANCRICTHRNPVIFDELVADAVEEQSDVDRYEDIREIEALPARERNLFFDELLASCIRCYACRNACPLCYCPTCFVDESKPQWVGKSQDSTDIRTFHFLRAYHCAGRCTDCGACERACPVGIEVRLLTKKLEKDCLELFDWEAGLSPDDRPPLDTYRPDDRNDFIK